MRALADDVHRELGALDVLVNNAGVGHSGGILDSTPAGLGLGRRRQPAGASSTGATSSCRRWSSAGRGGHVANVASAFGLFAAAGVAPYCTTKFAVVGLSESLRAELAPHGIGVSAICPGLINTDIIARGRFADEKLRGRHREDVPQGGHPPEQVARAVLHAIAENVAVVPVGAEAWAAWLGKRFVPGLAAIAGRRMPKAGEQGLPRRAGRDAGADGLSLPVPLISWQMRPALPERLLPSIFTGAVVALAQRVDEVDDQRVVPLARAVEAGADDAVLVDDHVSGNRRVPNLPRTMDDSGSKRTAKGGSPRRTVCSVGFTSSGPSSTETATTATSGPIAQDLRELGELGHLLEARAARLRPEVEDDDLAPQALEA